MTRIAAAFLLAGLASPAIAFELAFPVACTIGEDCVIQHYVDRDPGPGFSDYRCGSQTNDGHDGIDIRLMTLREMASGVSVVAAADGTVAALRDGMKDISVNDADPASIKDRECGNGVAIEHGDGWVTQYCHMKQGSILVKRGDRVVAGQPIAKVGMSGNTEFPHLHFNVRKDDVDIDPFAPEPASGGACAFAGDETGSLWKAEIRPAVAYRPAFVLNTGFSNGPIKSDAVESGELEDIVLKADSPAIVFYGRAIGIEKGDVQALVLTGPDGKIVASSEVEPTDRSKAQVFAFTGKKRRDALWPKGTYRGRYAILRGGAEVASREAEIEIAE